VTINDTLPLRSPNMLLLAS